MGTIKYSLQFVQCLFVVVVLSCKSALKIMMGQAYVPDVNSLWRID